MNEFHRVHADIYLDRIYHNIKRTREIIKEDSKIMAIVKADAYGHGAVAVSKVLYPLVDGYGVAILEEAVELREAGIDKPILILGFVPQEQMSDLVRYDVIPAVFTLDMARWVSEEAKKQRKIAKIHIKLDTGMSRIGFACTEESLEIIKTISQMENICIDGCFTHFCSADEENLDFAREQLRRYTDYVERIEEMGIKIPIKHISNSAGIIGLPEANKDMVRSGISTYGLYPSEEVDKKRLILEPALELKSYISYVKVLEPGVGISYNRTYYTDKITKVATIPVGYGDGYPRALSSKGRVLIRGKSAPIIGRICMDQFMVDVTEIEDVKQGDQVVLIGRDGKETISIEEIGALSYSFNYEVACDIGKRIPRVYIHQGKVLGTSQCKVHVDLKEDELHF